MWAFPFSSVTETGTVDAPRQGELPFGDLQPQTPDLLVVPVTDQCWLPQPRPQFWTSAESDDSTDDSFSGLSDDDDLVGHSLSDDSSDDSLGDSSGDEDLVGHSLSDDSSDDSLGG
ncbi:hypothetical protein ACOMHN_043826 [Nucella lapillus]